MTVEIGSRQLYRGLREFGEMNLKVANLIAAELAILIGLMSWMVYSRRPSAEPRPPVEIQESNAGPVATVAPVLEARNEPPTTVDSADREQARPGDEQPAPTSQEYLQEIAPQPYADAGLENGAIAADSPSYAEVAQEPAVTPSNYPTSTQTVTYAQPTETVTYAQPTQVVVYPQPVQIVVFSNSRAFANRDRSAHHPGAFMKMRHRRPGGQEFHRRGDGVGFPRNVCPPIQGFRPRGHR